MPPATSSHGVTRAMNSSDTFPDTLTDQNTLGCRVHSTQTHAPILLIKPFLWQFHTHIYCNLITLTSPSLPYLPPANPASSFRVPFERSHAHQDTSSQSRSGLCEKLLQVPHSLVAWAFSQLRAKPRGIWTGCIRDTTLILLSVHSPQRALHLQSHPTTDWRYVF